MLPRKPLLALVLLVPLAIVSLFAFAACDDDDDGDGPAATATQPSGTPPDGEIDTSGVPELQDGVLSVGSDIAYAPIEFYQEGTDIPDGLDIDLSKAIAAVLGVEAEFRNTGFDGIIPSLNANDFDIIMSAMTINEERLQQIDLIPYVNVGTAILVRAGNPEDIQSEEDLCGLTVAVQLGTIQERLVRDLSATCDESINVLTYDTNPLAVEDLRTGGAQANLADYPVALLDAEESGGDLEVVETQIDPEPYGIGVRKASTELRAVLEQALAAITASGEYGRILEKWGLSSAALQ